MADWGGPISIVLIDKGLVSAARDLCLGFSVVAGTVASLLLLFAGAAEASTPWIRGTESREPSRRLVDSMRMFKAVFAEV